jgi:hypothetical protein
MRIAKTASMVGVLCLVAVGGCAAPPETAADQVSPTPWIPTEPSYGAPVFPGAEFVLLSHRDPGEFDRTWVVVVGQGRSYCVEDEEFTTDASYADVVAWYRQRLGEKGSRPSVELSGKSWSWVVTDDRDAQVTVTVIRPVDPEGVPQDFTYITFEQREYHASSDACQSTIVYHDP